MTLSLLFVKGTLVSAQEETGGQVSVGGEITFYDKTEESSNSLDSPVEFDKNNLLTSPNEAKPSGRIPSLGELLGNGLWTGIALILTALVLKMMWNHREERKQ